MSPLSSRVSTSSVELPAISPFIEFHVRRPFSGPCRTICLVPLGSIYQDSPGMSRGTGQKKRRQAWPPPFYCSSSHRFRSQRSGAMWTWGLPEGRGRRGAIEHRGELCPRILGRPRIQHRVSTEQKSPPAPPPSRDMAASSPSGSGLCRFTRSLPMIRSSSPAPPPGSPGWPPGYHCAWCSRSPA